MDRSLDSASTLVLHCCDIVRHVGEGLSKEQVEEFQDKGI